MIHNGSLVSSQEAFESQLNSFCELLYYRSHSSDYVPFNTPRAFLKEFESLDFSLVTTADGIFEFPDETVSVMMSSPGLWPSILGRFLTPVTLLDNTGDLSKSEASSLYTKVYEQEATSLSEFGHSVAVLPSLQLMFASAPFVAALGFERCGRVPYFHLSTGVQVT